LTINREFDRILSSIHDLNHFKMTLKTIMRLAKQFNGLKKGKASLLRLIDEAEITESVYNSNAIENSTLTLKETEKILLDMELSRNFDLREVFEAKNLARVSEYLSPKNNRENLESDTILLLHKMLLLNIDDDMAGRFRKRGEYVRVGTHVAPAPGQIEQKIHASLIRFESDLEASILQKIARFHLEFEHIHPFLDGNGRIGRVLINHQLAHVGLPPIILRNKEKKHYYQALRIYDHSQKTEPMESILRLALAESLHKRMAYLKGLKIIPLVDYARHNKKSPATVLNAAKRQTIPAFRERGRWKIGYSIDSFVCQ